MPLSMTTAGREAAGSMRKSDKVVVNQLDSGAGEKGGSATEIPECV